MEIILKHKLNITCYELDTITRDIKITQEILICLDKINYNICSYNELSKFIHNFIKSSMLDHEKFLNVIHFFSEKGQIIDVDMIISCAEINTVNSKNITIKLLKTPYFKPKPITQKHLDTIFNQYPSKYPNYMDEPIKELFKICDYKLVESDLIYLCTTQITEPIFSDLLITYNINLTTLPYAETMFINSIKSNNYSMTKLFLDNKFQPKEEYIYNYLISKDEQTNNIIDLFIKYGLSISPHLYAYIKINCSYNGIVPECITQNMKKSIDTICDYNYSMLKPRFAQIKNIKHLVRLYEMCSLPEINNMIKKSTKKIEPDNSCFVAALRNPHIEVLLYVFEHYKYVPTVLDIIQIPDLKMRFFVLCKFYPSLVDTI
jgi:hypothetical protein